MVMRLETLRASSAPSAFRCPASVRAPHLAIRESGEAADIGSAAHEALRPLVEGRSVQWDELPALCERWSVPVDDVRILCAQAQKMWADMGEMFPEATTEVELSTRLPGGTILTGHIDFVATVGTTAIGGDWKTGRKDSDYAQQMRAYAALLLLDDLSLTSATFVIAWVRDGDVERYTMTRDGLHEWLASLTERVLEWDGTYHPGPHCGHCSRNHECDAANALVRRDVAAILDTPAEMASALASMPAGDIVSLLRKARMVSDYADRVAKAVSQHVQAHGDIVSDDARLTIQVEKRRRLKTLEAWPVLEAAGFGDEDMAACVEISASEAESIVAKRAGRGKGAGAVREFKAALEYAGAVEMTERRKLVERRS